MSETNITKENFASVVSENGNRVLLDFYATWCSPCSMLSPTIKEIAEEHPKLVVGKIDIDQQQDLAEDFGVASVPTLIVMDKGKEVKRHTGVMLKDEILKMLEI